MSLLFGQKILATLRLLLILSCSISCWLFRTQKVMSRIPSPSGDNSFHSKTTEAMGYTNGLTKSGQDFYIRQHGQYWVLYNYIKAAKEYTGNESVTLVLHGDCTDIVNFAETLKRWHGPISLTLFTGGEDFDWTLDVLFYLTKCTVYSADLYAFVSINLIMHQDFLPKNIPWEELEHYYTYVDCLDKFDFSKNERVKHNLTFPSNLARNVGRLTARTHFVLLLDVDIIPSAGIAKLFLKMIKAEENADHPQKTVYVLPSFDIKFNHIVPEHDCDFGHLDQQFLQLYLNSSSLHKILRLREWFETNNKSETGIFDKTRRWGHRLAYYISANDVEPFYDENYDRDSQIDRISHLSFLEALDYNFYIINVGFVVHRLLPPYNFYTEIPTKNYTDELIRLQILRDFYMMIDEIDLN